jgi:hypothetical protein
MKTNHRVQAVLDDDLAGVLQNLGLIDPLRNGELRCCACGDTVTEESLQGIAPNGKSISILCSKPACLKDLAGKGES